MTDSTIDHGASLLAEARALFEADPSSKMEAPWAYLAPYKRADWIRLAAIARHRAGESSGEDARLREALESIATARQEADDFGHPEFDWRLLAGRMEGIARRALADG